MIWRRTFLVLKGKLKNGILCQTVELNEQEFLIVPRGVEHRPVTENEVSALLFEPNTTLNAGDAKSNLTNDKLDFI